MKTFRPNLGLNHLPIGNLDGQTGDDIVGWAFDQNHPTYNHVVHIYIGGPAGVAQALLRQIHHTQTSIKSIRYRGFSLPDSFKDGVPRPYYVYAIDSTHGKNPMIGSGFTYQKESYTFSECHSNSKLPGWLVAHVGDRNNNTVYSSFSLPQYSSSIELAAWFKDAKYVSQLKLRAHRNAQRSIIGFPQAYRIYITNSDNSNWVPVSETNYKQPGLDGSVTIKFDETKRTYGILIVPEVLGTDNNGGFIFQLAELEALP